MSATFRNARADIGQRLRTERDRLDLSQEQMAECGGVAKRTQAAWEKGEQTPNAEYLALVAERGVDVLFVVTGLRTGQADRDQLISFLPADEVALLGDYRACDETSRQACRLVLSGLRLRSPGHSS